MKAVLPVGYMAGGPYSLQDNVAYILPLDTHTNVHVVGPSVLR